MNLAIMNNISDLRTEHVAARINMAKIKNALSAIGDLSVFGETAEVVTPDKNDRFTLKKNWRASVAFARFSALFYCFVDVDNLLLLIS